MSHIEGDLTLFIMILDLFFKILTFHPVKNNLFEFTPISNIPRIHFGLT